MSKINRNNVVNLFYWSLIALFLIHPFAQAQTCEGIVFKSKRLPRECKKVSPCGLRTLFLPRSQGANTARNIVGWHEYMQACDDRAWGNLSLAVEYAHSRNGERMAQYLFGSNRLSFSGSQVPNRGSDELLADYFGLPTEFRGAISFDPTIDNVILDFNFHIGLDYWWEGLYFMFRMPIVNTRWDLGIGCKEMNNIDSLDANTAFPDCYMGPQTIIPEEIINEQGMRVPNTQGKRVHNVVRAATSIRQALSGNFVFGDMEQPLMFGAFPCGRQQLTRVSNIDLILGWNWCVNEYSHAGVYLLTVVPTGNRPHGETVFEPMVGNGNLWEIGPGISGHYDFIRSGCHTLSLWFTGALTHMFERFQIRSFDLIGHGPLSRYMLLKEFDVVNGNFVYNGNLVNAVDFATRATHVGGSAKFDGSVKLSYYRNCWGLDLGYNLYARSKEKIRIQDDLFPSDLNNRRFGIKGTEGVCYRLLNPTLTPPQVVRPELPTPLNSTQNGSTIKHGAAIDNPVAIIPPSSELIPITWDSPTSGAIIVAQNSNPPIILDTDALDLTTGAVPHQLTHKFFGHIYYTALNCCWEPQFGFGGEIEFDGRSELLSSLNQWGIWFKGALAF